MYRDIATDVENLLGRAATVCEHRHQPVPPGGREF
jgi:hypothetical protein